MDLCKTFLDKPILSISSYKITNCSEVVNTLKNLGIISQVNHNISIVKNNDKFITENGCNIKFIEFPKNQSLKNTWEILKINHELTCAHLEIPGKYTGCIYNYLRPSSCPIK